MLRPIIGPMDLKKLGENLTRNRYNGKITQVSTNATISDIFAYGSSAMNAAFAALAGKTPEENDSIVIDGAEYVYKWTYTGKWFADDYGEMQELIHRIWLRKGGHHKKE